MHEMVHMARDQICVAPDAARFAYPDTKPWMDKYYSINNEWVADGRRKLLALRAIC
ncbi:MAG: hypothetical protein L3J36_16505 [Rhodobacteraceae bacterium]|nr:hypothetical protein [Paracoccaceae bacterium]